MRQRSVADQPGRNHGMAQGAVIVAACHPSDDVTTRFATFVGEMRALPGSARMAMRFTLLQRLGTPDFTAVGLPDLRPWRRSKKGVSSFIYTQRVTALRDGDTYRMRVQMRWYGSNGKLMKVRTMRSGACKQPAPLPNLRISSISTAPGAVSGTTSYMVTVQNDGAGDTGPVVVGLRVDGGTLSTARVPTLRPVRRPASGSPDRPAPPPCAPSPTLATRSGRRARRTTRWSRRAPAERVSGVGSRVSETAEGSRLFRHPAPHTRHPLRKS